MLEWISRLGKRVVERPAARWTEYLKTASSQGGNEFRWIVIIIISLLFQRDTSTEFDPIILNLVFCRLPAFRNFNMINKQKVYSNSVN